MMQRYSYELVSNLIKEFSRGTVVTLNIEQQGSDFVVDYTYLRDYKENEQKLYPIDHLFENYQPNKLTLERTEII